MGHLLFARCYAYAVWQCDRSAIWCMWNYCAYAAGELQWGIIVPLWLQYKRIFVGIFCHCIEFLFATHLINFFLPAIFRPWIHTYIITYRIVWNFLFGVWCVGGSVSYFQISNMEWKHAVRNTQGSWWIPECYQHNSKYVYARVCMVTWIASLWVQLFHY